MNISLTPKLEELVKQKVETGLYNSASEVIREALRLLDERDRDRAAKLEHLKQAIQKGLDSGYNDNTVEEIIAEAKQSRDAQK